MGRKDAEGRSDVEKFRKNIGEGLFHVYVYVAEKCLLATLRVYLRASVILLKRELEKTPLTVLFRREPRYSYIRLSFTYFFSAASTLLCARLNFETYLPA